MVESTEAAVALSRDSIPELIRVIGEGGDDAGVSWNVVESLELLLDAGAIKDAHALATSVVQMLGDDRRNRLFKAYLEFCNLLQGSSLHSALERVEEIAIEIEHGGFSNDDQCWSNILLARTIAVGVYSRALGESEILRARHILSSLLTRLQKSASPRSMLRVGVDLARTYLQCPTPEVPAARELLEKLMVDGAEAEASADVLFDVYRLLFQISDEETHPAQQLREYAHPLGAIARGLAELSIARRQGKLTEETIDALEATLPIFEQGSYRSGEFEVLATLATEAAECDHHAKAQRLFQKADRIASHGGFIYGRGVALLGTFHSSIGSCDYDNAAIAAEKLRLLSSSDIFLGAFGLNIVAAHQLLGRAEVATRLATKCEKMFVIQGARGLAGQAAFMVGASYADAGKWKLARSAWKRALVCDELRRAHISSCDRRAALAQAIAMADFSDGGALRESTISEVKRLLAKSEEVLAPFGRSNQALEALGKSLHIHAQLSILARTPLEALKHLGRARECFSQLGFEKEIALTDGLTGLSLLEAAKQNGPHLLEEAMNALQRALEYFQRVQRPRVTWKIRYYLAVAALLRSQGAPDPGHRQGFRQMALTLLEEASVESTLLEREPGMARAGSGEGDFSPGLKPEVLAPLKEALGVKPRKDRIKGAGTKEHDTSRRYKGQLH